MSAENGKFCLNCRHYISILNQMFCEVDKHYIGYVESYEGWCKHWSRERREDERRKRKGLL